MKFVSAHTFKAVLRRDIGAARELAVRKLFLMPPEPEPAPADDGEDELIRFTITTNALDREKDIVAIDGWDLANFEKNPVVLWGHGNDEPPIGRAMRTYREGDALKSEVKFVPADVPIYGPRAEGIRQMCRRGFLHATSVGFRPLEFRIAEDRDDGESWFPPIDFLRQELMEFSVVSIPANPEALIDIPAAEAAQASPDAAMAAAAALHRIRQRRRQRRLQARLIALA